MPTAEAFFRSRFEAEGDPKSAASQRAYMKSALEFHGVGNAVVRRTAKDYALGRLEDLAELQSTVDALMESRFFDVRLGALALVERKAKWLGRAELPWLITLVRRGGCWAMVDWVATGFIAPVMEAEPKALPLLDRWAKDHDFWVRRTSLLAQEPQLRRGGGDFERFATLAATMLDEKEFFIRKAIGWVLRSTSKQRPALVFAFLKAHRARVSGLTLREGAKYLPAAQRTALGLK